MSTYVYAHNDKAGRGELHAPGCAHLESRNLEVMGVSYEGTSAKDSIVRMQAKYADDPTPHIAPCAR